MQVVSVPLKDLVPYAKNSRKHSKAQVIALARSLKEFGWTNPVLVDGDRGIIAGHGRVMAAMQLAAAGEQIPNWPTVDQAPTIELRHLSPEQRRAYVIADNQLALGSSWDGDVLKSELAALAGDDFDMSLLGFDDDKLRGLLPAELLGGLTDPDDVPDVQAANVAAVGDIWVLDRHRLACGDSTDAALVARLLGAVKPHLMVTDPPYGVKYDADWRNDAVRANGEAIGGRATGVVLNDDRADWREAWALFPGEVAYVWHAGRFSSTVQASLEAEGFEMRTQIIWGKSRFAISRGDYHWQHEPCWYAVRKGGKGHWGGARDQSTLWTISHQKSETGHSTQKPVECMRRPIENNSSPGQAVYEPFSGSGTTIIAAEQTGRCAYAVELNPAYVDVGIRRWQSFTGLAAVREADGLSFAQVEALRHAAQ